MALLANKVRSYINPVQPDESFKVATNAIAFVGSLIGANATGFIDRIPGPGVNNAAFRVAGLSHASFSNVGGANAAFDVRVDRPNGADRFDVLAADPVTQADILRVVFAEDDGTIRRTDNAGTRCAAGTLYAINTDGTVAIKLLQP